MGIVNRLSGITSDSILTHCLKNLLAHFYSNLHLSFPELLFRHIHWFRVMYRVRANIVYVRRFWFAVLIPGIFWVDGGNPCAQWSNWKGMGGREQQSGRRWSEDTEGAPKPKVSKMGPGRQISSLRPVAGSRVGLGGFKPTHFQKKAPMRFSQIRRLFLGGGGGRVEREKAWAVSDCVKQTATSLRCYYSVQLRSLIYCSDHCRFWNPIQSRFA